MVPKSQTILIVEDDDVLKEIVKKGLENASHTVLTASTGQEMFDALDRTPVNLILLDLGLPDGDALPHILKIREQTDAPLVILTARERIDDRLMALGLGADDYLTKPIDIRELVLRVNNILSRRADGQNAASPTPPSAPHQGRRGSEQAAPHRRAGDTTPHRRASDNTRSRRASDSSRRSPMLIVGGVLIGIAGAGTFWLSIGSPKQATQLIVESTALEIGEQSEQPSNDPTTADTGDDAAPAANTNGDRQDGPPSETLPTETAESDTERSQRTALAVAETVTVSEPTSTTGNGTSVMVTATPTTG